MERFHLSAEEQSVFVLALNFLRYWMDGLLVSTPLCTLVEKPLMSLGSFELYCRQFFLHWLQKTRRIFI